MSLGDPCWACTHEWEDHAPRWPHGCYECDCDEFFPVDLTDATQAGSV